MRYPLRAHAIFLEAQGGGGRRISPNFKKKKKFLYLWAHLHNLIRLNNNFSILKKIENPILNPRKIYNYMGPLFLNKNLPINRMLFFENKT